MYSVVPMRIAKISHIVLSAILSVLGIVLILRPDFSVSMLEKICGIFLILFGAAKTIGYLSKDIYRLAFQYDFVFGFILAGIGIIFLLRTESVLTLVSILLGVVIFSDGVIKILVAWHAKSFGIGAWWAIFALAVLAVIGGLVAAIHRVDDAQALAPLLGCILIIESALSIVTVITSVKIKEYEKNCG